MKNENNKNEFNIQLTATKWYKYFTYLRDELHLYSGLHEDAALIYPSSCPIPRTYTTYCKERLDAFVLILEYKCNT